MGKQDFEFLLPHPTSTPSGTSRKSLGLILSLFALLVLLAPSPLSTFTGLWRPSVHRTLSIDGLESTCGQAEPIVPPMDFHNVSSVRDYKDQIIKWHQGAIRVNTAVFDEMGEPGEDPKWDNFFKFHEYLAKAYPLIHKNLKLTKVDTLGLIYEWIGTDTSLQPLMLTAHQDEVPVLPETLWQWEQPPFEGVYDGTWIWGRGSSDDKSGLTSVMAAVELLLQTSDFKPRRTIILGFGHDEDRGGQRGAPAIRDWLLETYGKDSMAMIVDEGSGLSHTWGRTFATPAVAEKGKLNLNLTVSTLGGHSSIPPHNTNIGLTAALIVAMEKNPHPIQLEENNPLWSYLQCAGRYAPEMPSKLKKSVGEALKSDKAFKALPEEIMEYGLGSSHAGPGNGNMAEALLHTSQAIDMINGGFKINALPEVVTTFVNHRVSIHSTLDDVRTHIFETMKPVAKEYNLAIAGWEDYNFSPSDKPWGVIHLKDAFEISHGPAPITPTTLETPAWRVFAGTGRGMWASRAEISEDGSMVDLAGDEEMIFAPFMGTGNTDTRRYWDLTRNIYRFRYFPENANAGAHTINERVSADAMVEFIRYYQSLILNVDASTEL